MHIGGVRVVLRAEHEVVSVNHDGTNCHALDGGKTRTGRYLIQSEVAGHVVSSIDLGGLLLADGYRHDGLRTVKVPGVGPVAAVYQPDGCHWSQLRLFRVADAGRLLPVPFVDGKGVESDRGWTSRLPIVDSKRRLELCQRSTELEATSLPGYVCSTYRYERGRLVLDHEWESPDVRWLEKGSRSVVAIGAYRVFLYAADERASVETENGCVADAGSRRFAGHYRLIVTKDDRTISSLDVGPHMFAEGRLHDGLRTINVPGHRLLAVPSYLSCSGGTARLYRVDDHGGIETVRIVGSVDSEVDALPTAYAPAIERAGGPLVFCDWSNVTTSAFCTAYRFDGRRLVWTDQWDSTSSDWRSWRRPTAEWRARATLVRFLAHLEKSDHAQAGKLYQGPAVEVREFLEACPSGRLATIDGLEHRSRRRGETFQFTVSFQEGEYRLQFDVVGRGRGFRVARLPICGGAQK